MKRALIWIAVTVGAVAVGFGLGALTYHPPTPDLIAAGSPTTPPPPTHTPALVPDVVGMNRAAAEKRLDALGLLFLVHPVGGKDDGRVTAQFPQAGVPVAQAKHVLLNVRCNPRPCPPPPEGKQMYDPCACLWR